MAKRATHQGICQACGRLQLLPGGVLSDHGYEIRDGWRAGSCMGVGHLPFEISKDLIEDTIAWAIGDAERLEAMAAEWRARRVSTDDLECWYKVYHPELSNRTRGAVRLWELGQIELIDGRLHFVPANGREPDRVHRMGKPEELAAEYRKAYADALNSKAGQQRAYADYQRERLVGWEPKELQLRAA